jgi:hypothetical protein
MAELDNISVNEQEVAEPVTETVETGDNLDVETAKPQQTAEENAHFAEERRKQEIEKLRNEKAESERKFAEMESKFNALSERTKETLSAYWDGDSADDVLLKAQAQAEGVDYEQLKAEQERALVEARQREEANYYKDLYLNSQAEALMAKDLAEIQAIDSNVKSLDELGADFGKLVCSGSLSAVEAYNIIKSRVKPLPPTSAPIKNGNASVDKGFFTRDEVKAMTQEEVRKNYEKIQNSMGKWE